MSLMINLQIGMLTIILLSDLYALGSPRTKTLIKTMAVQGLAVSLMPLLITLSPLSLEHGEHQGIDWMRWIFTFIMLSLKGCIIPAMLFYTLKKVVVAKDTAPIIGYHSSVLLGIAFILIAIYVSNKWSLPYMVKDEVLDVGLLFTTAVTTTSAGLSILMLRRKAISQVVGYLMMENGIYLVGTIFVKEIPYVLEFAILLDLLVAVMIMGIVVHNISETFNDIDTSLLTTLKDEWND